MGARYGYSWSHEDACPKCHNSYSFEINAYEYPEGVLEYEEAPKSNGVEVECKVDVATGLIEDWDESWKYIEPSTYDEFNETIQELRNMLNSDLSSEIVFKMIDAFAVTAMEAYLSGTLINQVKCNDAYLINAAEKVIELKDEKISLSSILKNPNEAKSRVLSKLYEFMYHNIPKIKQVYEAVFDVKFNYPLKDIMQIVMRRHDIVHRNGKNKEGGEIVLTRDMIKQDLNVISIFVKAVNDLVFPATDLETTMPTGC